MSKAIVGEALASSFLDSSLRMLEQWFAIVIALLFRSVPLCRAGFFWHRPDGRPRQKKPKGLAPTSGPSFAGVPSFHHCSGGRPGRAIHGPSGLSPHPCGSSPCTMIPLGLLEGRLVAPDNSVA
ncbi:hypothetical protein F7R01_10745 [Pseudomonas argentinensis]|nr:hypothetical protein F7R01_10745 [Pseudomonas argentinensis]